MDKQKEIFIQGCHKNGINNKDAISAFDIMSKFAEYGFNKSHAIAYSKLSYQTAYLKTYHLKEFMAACLTEVSKKQDKTIEFLNDCKLNGVKVLPPDINKSELMYSPSEEGVRFGLGAIKNFGMVGAEYVLKERKKGYFKNIFDFCERINLMKVNSAKIKTLIISGCFDEVG
jgi:DNA polymerase-3 subunit alpha